jgi:hypothetical protein
MDSRYTARLAGGRRRPKYSARPFVITIAIILFFTLASILPQRIGTKSPLSVSHTVARRDLIVQDEEVPHSLPCAPTDLNR